MADWDVSEPGGGEYVSQVDNIIRGDKETLRDAINEEHDFKGSDVTGYHKPGTARIHVVATDNDLPTGSVDKKEGRLCFVTDSNNLYYADGSSWKLVHPTRNQKLESRDIGSGDISTTETDWEVVNWGSGGEFTFETDFTTTGGHIRMVLTVTGWAQTEPVYFNLQVDDEDPPGTTLDGLGYVYADSSTKRYGTVGMHWCTSREGAGGVPPRGDPPPADDHTVKVLWRVDSGGTGGLVGGMSHHLYLEEV